MAGGKKYQTVVVISDSEDDAGIGDLRQMELSEEEADELSPSSDDEDLSDTSSFQPSSEGSESIETDKDSADDQDYQQSEDDHVYNGAAEASSSSNHTRSADEAGDDDALCNRVVQLLKDKRDIGHLSLQVYRAYLRKNGLRISGTKAESLMRIHEHWRIKDGSGEALYPRSSFTLNCTGDVCKGDVVQFRQRVYQKFEKLTRSGKVQGSRIVAGRIVKESYGAAKQQHTFTVEVLWSKGTKKLPPLFPLLVKGRNLYRLKTFRQPWKNEAERSKALDEKHTRGAIARQKRSMRVQARKMPKIRQSSDKGSVHQKHQSASIHTRDSHSNHSERGKHGDQRGKASANREKGQGGTKAVARETTGARTFKPASRHKKSTCDGNKASTSVSHSNATYQQFHRTQMHSDYRNAQFPFHRGSAPTSMGPSVVHNSWSQHYHQPPHGSYSYSSQGPSSSMFLPDLSSGVRMHQNRRSVSCSTRGCRNLGSEECAISGCWQCCRRAGYRCHVHK